MGKRIAWTAWPTLVFALSLVLGGVSSSTLAGDEDVKAKQAKPAPTEPAPMEAPPEPEAPDLTLGEEPENNPIFTEEAPPAAPARPRRSRPPWDPDLNINYAELMALAEPAGEGRGVLPPALGTRGYRPNLVAGGVGDRTPGFGGMVEYSWNRWGAGVYYSYRTLKDVDRFNLSQSFAGVYTLYRWLPFDFSPYLLTGLEIATETPDEFGGLLGLGMEARLYSGWTILLGYTYHSTAHKGFLGGAFGWTF